MKVVVGSGPYFKKGDQGFYFEFGPTWHVWLTEIVDAVDSVTRHRFCFWLQNTCIGWMDKHRTKMYVSASEEEVQRFYDAAGWVHYPDWHDSEG